MNMHNPPRLSAHAALIGRDAGLLLLRLAGFGLLWTFHLERKLANLSDELASFPDPLGMGHGPSLVLAILSEGGCSLLVALGLATRLTCLPIVFSMLVVVALASSGFDAADLQAALLYSAIYIALAFLGAGRISLDHLLRARGVASRAGGALAVDRA